MWLLVIKSVTIVDYGKQWMFSLILPSGVTLKKAVLRPKNCFVWTAATNKTMGVVWQSPLIYYITDNVKPCLISCSM